MRGPHRLDNRGWGWVGRQQLDGYRVDRDAAIAEVSLHSAERMWRNIARPSSVGQNRSELGELWTDFGQFGANIVQNSPPAKFGPTSTNFGRFMLAGFDQLLTDICRNCPIQPNLGCCRPNAAKFGEHRCIL